MGRGHYAKSMLGLFLAGCAFLATPASSLAAKPAPAPKPAPLLWAADGPVEEDWSRQDAIAGKPTFDKWQDPAAYVKQTVAPCVDEQLARAAQILSALRRRPDAASLAVEADAIAAAAKAREELLAAGSVDPAAWKKVYLSARWAARRVAMRHPGIEGRELLFVRRHHAHYGHQCARRLAAATKPGGGICILDAVRPDLGGKVRFLTEGRFAEGVYGRPDISFDGKRIVFGYGAARPEGGGFSEGAALVDKGFCFDFQVYEMVLDASGSPRQLTRPEEGRYSDTDSGQTIENCDPIYLPNGRIAYMSHRAGGLVQCGDWALAYCIWGMNADGSDKRQITWAKEGEWDPSLMDDGTILFTRWEYMMRFWSPTQMIWNVRPDGTNPRVVYGSDLERKYGESGYAYPLNYAMSRQIPAPAGRCGTSKVVCIGSAHHNTGAGPVCIVDLDLGRENGGALNRLTPVRFVETPDRMPHAGWYDCPWPLDENFFLVSYSFSQSEADTTGYGLYLLDTFGGKELILRDAELSAMFPMPIAPRRRPAAFTELNEGDRRYGEFFVQDATEYLPGWARGRAKYLRVVEAFERKVHTRPYNIEVGPNSGFEVKKVLGTVPVEADGSAHFRVPAGAAVFFSVLDANHQALHTMRMTTTARAGERMSCIGCHEPLEQAPANRQAMALRRGASDIAPPPWGMEHNFGFARHVQPILNRHCVRCHDGSASLTTGGSASLTTGGSGAAGKAFDLTTRQARPFMSVPIEMSYYNLRKHVATAGIHQYYTPPGSWGSRVSPLMDHLAKGHPIKGDAAGRTLGLKLEPAEWQALCAWIDCNGPYLDDYRVVAADEKLKVPRFVCPTPGVEGLPAPADVKEKTAPKVESVKPAATKKPAPTDPFAGSPQ